MELANLNPTHFKPTHRAKLWMTITIVIVLLGATGVYYYAKKTYDVKQEQKTVTSQQEQEVVTQLPAEPADQAKQVSEELKQVNLAEFQAAVKDIKDIVAAF